MNMRGSRTAVLVVIGILVGAIAGGVIAVHLDSTKTVTVDGTLPLNSPNDTTIFVNGTTYTALLTDPFTLDGTVNVVTEQGNATFFSNGNTNLTIQVSEIEGPWTNVTQVDADPNSIQIDPEDKSQVTIGQEIDSFNYTGSYGVDDGTIDFIYAGTTGTSRVTITGVPSNTTLGAVDASTGNLLDSATSDGSGAITFDALTNSEHSVLLQTGEAPTISDPSPTGDLSNPPSELSVQVNDTDFPSDTVTVEFSLDGSVVGTQTTSTNATVSQSISNPAGGSHTWSVDVNDEYGNTVNQSFSFNVPTNLTVREETPPHGIIDHKTIKATCYEDVTDNPTILNRTASDGKIDLTGFPTGSEFACQLSVPNYHNRTVLLDSLYDQKNAFLINKSQEAVENRFLLLDRTGNFPTESSELIVQAAINQSLYSSGGYKWLNVAGDDLGADASFTTDLIFEDRYRIVVRNEDGDTRVLGGYTALQNITIELEVGNIVITPTDRNEYDWSGEYLNGTTPKLRFKYTDPEQNTTDLRVIMYERGNRSNEVYNASHAGPFGNKTVTQMLSGSNADINTWVIEFQATRNGESISGKMIVGPRQGVGFPMDPFWKSVAAVALLIIVSGLLGGVKAEVGILSLPVFAGLLWYIKWLPTTVGAGAIILALFVGVLYASSGRTGGAQV